MEPPRTLHEGPMVIEGIDGALLIHDLEIWSNAPGPALTIKLCHLTDLIRFANVLIHAHGQGAPIAITSNWFDGVPCPGYDPSGLTIYSP